MQVGQFAAFEEPGQVPRITEVVFHRIARLGDLGALKPGDGPDQILLDVFRKGCRDPVRIHEVTPKALGLKVNRVALLVCEADDLVLDGRAIPWALAGNPAAIQGGPPEVLPYDVMRRPGRRRDAAGDLTIPETVRVERQECRPVVTRLRVEHVPVDAVPAKARGSSGLEPAGDDTEPAEAVRQRDRGRISHPSGGPALVPDMDLPAEECPGRQDHPPRGDRALIRQDEHETVGRRANIDGFAEDEVHSGVA